MVHWVLLFWFLALLAGVSDLALYGLLARLRRSKTLVWLVGFLATSALELVFSLGIQYSVFNLGDDHPATTVTRLLHFLVLGGYLVFLPRLVWSLRSHTPGRAVRWGAGLWAALPALTYLLLLTLTDRAGAQGVEPVALVAVFTTFLYQAVKLRLQVAQVTSDFLRPRVVRGFPFFLAVVVALFFADLGSWLGLFGPSSAMVAMVSGPAVFLVMHLVFLLVGVQSLVRLYQSRQTDPERGPDFTRFGFSSREIDVARLVLDGLSNAQIADRLFISERTVKNHVYNIFQKTQVDSRVSLVNRIRGSVPSPKG